MVAQVEIRLAALRDTWPARAWRWLLNVLYDSPEPHWWQKQEKRNG